MNILRNFNKYQQGITINKQSHLCIVYNKIEVLNILYKTRQPMSTLWYTEETEDADFGEWLFNILNSELRRSIFIENKV